MKCFFLGRIAQVEPLLQEVDAEHPLDANGRTALFALGIEGLDEGTQFFHGTILSISARDFSRRVCFTLFFTKDLAFARLFWRFMGIISPGKIGNLYRMASVIYLILSGQGEISRGFDQRFLKEINYINRRRLYKWIF